MAGNRVCKIVQCNGEDVILCGPAWFMNNTGSGGGAWLHCLVLKHQMRVGNSGGGLHPSGAYLTWARPLAVQQRLELADPIDAQAVDLTITAEEETKPKYMLLKVAAVALVGYLLWKHFKK